MLGRILLSVLVSTLMNNFAVAQGQPPKAGARELFYISTTTRRTEPQHPTAPPLPIPLGLRYSILKGAPDGKFREVDPDTIFRTGDHIKLTIKANDSGYLYIVQQGASGQWKVLFPSDQIDSGGNRIAKDRSQEIPEATYFNFTEPAGEEKLFVVLSREPEADWDKLIHSVGGGKPAVELRPAQTASIDDSVIKRTKQSMNSRDLVYEKVNEEGKDSAVYIVNVAPKSGNRIQADISLKHR